MHNVLTVTQLNRYLKKIISHDPFLSDVYVSGEISNFKLHSSGHMYFTLKDSGGVVKCVMFSSQNRRINFRPEDGMKVIARGHISVYEASGQYQLYPQELVPDGVGSLHIAFEQLKDKLNKEGLFDSCYKKPIPYLPSVIGVVTSRTGAVIKDIMNVLYRRFPNMSVKIFPTAVQGEDASNQIAVAIKSFNRIKNVDVIIIARGGGSLEDLWPFNEEIVARSIFESHIPVISAVGHETDYTISDFVSDLRAPTPSAAAELVVAEKTALLTQVYDYRIRMKNMVADRIKKERVRLEGIKSNAVFTRPFDRINQNKQDVDHCTRYLKKAMEQIYNAKKSDYMMMAGKLETLSPLTVLSRGYSIAKKRNGKLVKSVADIKSKEELIVTLSDGDLICMVEDKESRGEL